MRIFAIFTLATLIIAFKAGSTLDQVVSDHKAATGHPVEKATYMIKQSGTYSIAGKAEIAFIIYHYNGGIRVEYYYDAKNPAVTVYTPDSSWKTNPWDLDKKVKLNDYEQTKMREWALLTGVVCNYKALEYMPVVVDNPDKNDNHILIQLLKQDKITRILARIDPETNLLSSTELVEWKGGGERRVPTYYKEYEQVAGLMLPKKIIESFSKVMTVSYNIDKIETGVKFKKKLFKKP